MMIAEEHLREGRLQPALDVLQAQIRTAPADPKLRIFLFQLLAVLGQWERSLKQLQVAATLDASATTMAQCYRELIRCELIRQQVFRGQRAPVVLGEPARWLEILSLALTEGAEGRLEAAEQLRAEALALAPASPGSFDGQPFEWLADSDSRLGPVLEVIVRGQYCWLPFDQLRALEISPPVDLRDLVWLPAKLTFVDGEAIDGFIPTRYPDSEHSEDDAIRLSRKTEWSRPSSETAYGLGQRLLATDEVEVGLLDVRVVAFSERPAASSTARAVRGDRLESEHG